MQYKAVLFDLDGTLLPLDQDVFVKTYFTKLAMKMAKNGYDPEKYVNTIKNGVVAMRDNDGMRTNEEVFWDVYHASLGEISVNDSPHLDEFYHTEFQTVRDVTGTDPDAAETIRRLKERGVPIVLATNPMFPPIATLSRVEWAGLSANDFEFITTYDNINYCKPNPEYYRELCRRIEFSPEDCVMIGNDVTDDMVARTIGMDVFLLTDNLINRNNEDISEYPHGGYKELWEYLGI